LNDAVESKCVRQLFGTRADRVPGSSTKSMIGHPQGASGAAGIVTTALALSRGLLPPTINQHDPDPACDLDYIPNTVRAAPTVAARGGARVLMLDRARFPRAKLCGDTINPGALAMLRRLGMTGECEASALRLDGMIVTGERGVRVRAPYGGGVQALSIVRHVL